MHLFCILLHIFIPGTISTRVYLKRDDINTKFEVKNEKRFPNGSVIGTYSYKDENGNPIYVRYYADDLSYGVELKSVKTEGSDQTKKQDTLPKIENTVTSTDIFEPTDSMSTTKSIAQDFYKNNSYNTYEILKSYPNNKNKGHHKSEEEYEIFLENVLKPSEKYNKERVRVYVDRNKRKIRKMPHRYKVIN